MHNEFIRGLSYQCTNENLNAITLSLKPEEIDRILAIGGSGDQSFAMLEKGAEVICVDLDQKQIQYIKQRCELLKEENHDRFLKSTEELLLNSIKQRNNYFRKFNRLNKIRDNLPNLEVRCENILDTAKGNEKFTKIYLSNMVSYFRGDTFKTHEKFKEFIKQLTKRLTGEGLIYIANHNKACNLYNMPSTPSIRNEKLRYPIPNPKGFLPDGLEIDEERSTIALIHEKNIWNPAVYRKIK